MSRPPVAASAVLVFIVVTLALPALLPASTVSTYVLLELTAVVSVGVSMLMGCAGQVSLGQGAFYACGAYTAALMAVHGLPTLFGLIVAPIVAALLATLIGVPVLTLRGHYLAFATLATHLICLSIAGRLPLVGGDIGLQGIPRLSVLSFELAGDRHYAYIAWGAVALAAIVSRNVIASRPGRALRALAYSEVAAESLGVPVSRTKLAVFALAGGFAGLAGGIYAFFMGYVAPGSFPLLLSFEYVVMTVVGGSGTVSGALVGAGAVTLVVQLLNWIATLRGMPSYAPAVLSYAAYSALLIVCMLFVPEGLMGNKRMRRALLLLTEKR